MWVQVTHTDGDYLVGTLDNDPLLVEKLEYGDEVRLLREQIEAVGLNFDEWMEEIRLMNFQDFFFNEWLGFPKEGSGIELYYDTGCTARQALIQWRVWSVGMYFCA